MRLRVPTGQTTPTGVSVLFAFLFNMGRARRFRPRPRDPVSGQAAAPLRGDALGAAARKRSFFVSISHGTTFVSSKKNIFLERKTVDYFYREHTNPEEAIIITHTNFVSELYRLKRSHGAAA